MPDESKRLIIWAETGAGVWCHIDNADKSACYQCIACHRRLILRQGDVRIFHFAHVSDCHCTGESVIHAMAKDIIAGAHSLSLPPTAAAGVVSHNRDLECYEYDVPELSSPFTVVSGSTEQKISPDWICDSLCMGQSELGVAVEVRYMNRKSAQDIEKYEQHDIPVVEVDVREFDTSWLIEKARHWVLFEAPRKWLHCRSLKQAEQRARQGALTLLLERVYSKEKPIGRGVRMPAQRGISRQGSLPRFERAVISYEKGEQTYIKISPIYARQEKGLNHLVKLPHYQPILVTVKKRDINPKFGWSGVIQIENERDGGVQNTRFITSRSERALRH